jgi:hypothetical protein
MSHVKVIITGYETDPRAERKKALLNSLLGHGEAVAAEGHGIQYGWDRGYEEYDDEMEWYIDNQFTEGDAAGFQPKRPTGNILHFIPSEQIKLLKGKNDFSIYSI